MQAVGGIGTSGASVRRRSGAPTAPAEPAISPPGRALVAIDAPAASESTILSARRPYAAFLAHLIATDRQAPQTRARRRAAPAEAVAIYTGAMAQAPAAAGRIVARTT